MTVKIEDMFGNAAYEFVDLIKADPLVSESSPSMDVNKDKFRSVQRSEKITQRAQDTSDKATADVAKRKMSAQARVQLPNIKKEERLVDKILGELEEATPRPKATQRGKISKAEAQKRQAKEDRKRAAQERRDDRAKAGIDALIGSDADRKAAAAARANPEGQRKKALKRTLADRMARGAEKHGLEEGDFWHPDPEKDRKLGGPGANQRAREDRAAASQPKSDPKKLRPGESYMDYAKRMKNRREEVEIEEKLSTQYKDKTKLGQSSERKSLGRGSSIKDGSKKTGYESPKEFRDASMSLRKHRERFGDLATEGKYSSSVRATYGGKTETFPVEVYKKKGKEKKQVSEGDLKDRARRAVQNQRDGYHGDDDALTKEMGKTKKSVDKLKNSNVVTRYSADAAAKKLEKSIKKEEITIDERVRLEADNGNLLMVVAAWKGKSYQLTMFFPQPSMPTREEVESEIQKVYPGSRLMSYRITRRGEGQPIMQVVNSHSKNYLLNNGNIGEDVVNNAVNYFIYEGINEDGLEIFIEELGVENFVEFVHDLVEDSELIESYALTGKKKSPKRLPKGTQPAKTTKATIARGDSKIKAAAPSGAFKKRPAAKKAVETAKEKQPEKKPVRDAIARGIFRAVDAYKKGMERHNAAMKTAKKAGKVAGAIAKGAGEGVKTAGKAVKMAHAVATKEEVELAEDKREEKARRAELAKKHGIDLTKPGARAKLIRLMSADTKSKNRKAKGDTRTDKEVRKDRADDRKAFDRQRKDMEYRGKSKDEIKKSMKKMRDEVRSVNDPVNAPPSREKVRVKVGMKVDKPADAPKTGRNKPTAEKRADRKSYEAQQRRNAKEQQNEDWQKVNRGDKTDGMSKKAVAAYRRENPGSKLKTAVTGKVKKGSKDAKRRKSFCARSKGQQDMHNIDCSKTPDKPVCKARRRWKC